MPAACCSVFDVKLCVRVRAVCGESVCSCVCVRVRVHMYVHNVNTYLHA